MSLLEKSIREAEEREKQKIQVEDKKPPKTSKIIDDIELDEGNKITFEEIANSSEFKRLVYLIQFGKTHRGKSEDLERKLIKRQQEITIIKEIERGSKGAFNLVVKELKEKLAKQKVKIGE